MTTQLVNCKPCMQDKHDKCKNSKTCLCANDKHGENLRNGVKVNDKLNTPQNEPKEYENCLKDALRLEELIDNGRGSNSEEFTLKEITKLLISSRHLVSIIDIEKELTVWCKIYNIKLKPIKYIISDIFSNSETFTMIKQICFNLGRAKQKIIFDKTQLIELSHYLMGRYHIKRVELTGDLIFFNDQRYEKEAEALIRRKSRECLSKSKNNDMNEIIKMIEDTCQLLKSSDIEKYVHLKCLLNGTYNIITGIFKKEFNPDYIILNQIPHNYNEKIKFTTINKIVCEIIIVEEDRQSYYDFLSTCLHPYTGIDIQLGGVGIAGTGKSQLCKLPKFTFGGDNVKYATVHSIAKDPTTQKDVAYVFLNIDEELKSNDIENIEVLKKWIMQEYFTARSIYGHNSDFRPTSRLMFATNGIYEIGNPDDALAMYERTHLIKLDQKFRHTDKEIKNVFEIIDEVEYDGFITYLLNNATEIYSKKNIHYPQSTQKTESLWNEYGNDIRGFIDKWLEKGIGLKEQSGEIWNRFFSEQSDKGKPPRGRNQFYKKFDEIIGSTATQIRNGEDRYWGYLGYSLRTIDEKDKQEKIDATPKGEVLKILFRLEINNPKFEKILKLLE